MLIWRERRTDIVIERKGLILSCRERVTDIV